MTDNRTTELLQELRDLAEDVNPSEIIDHVRITSIGVVFDARWLDAWHMEFDRIMQAIAATLGSGTCENISDPPEGFLCSGCGWGDFAEPSHLLTTAKFTGNEHGPNYCPNCGCKVVGE